MRLHAMYILLIEDNLGDARLVREALRSAGGAGYELQHAARLDAGLAALAAGGVEVVLLDLSLPDSHGLATVVAVRAQAPAAALIVLTGLDDETTALKALELGAQDYLVKGEFDGRALWRAIRYAGERQRNELALRANQQELREAQAIAGLGRYVLDFTTGLWTSSEICDQIFGIDAAYGRSVAGWAALIHPADRQLMVDYFTTEVVGQHQRFDKDYRIIRPSDQAERWVHGVSELKVDSQQQLVELHGIITDITARKQAEAQLELQGAALHSAASAIMITDVAGTIEWANPAFETMTGYTAAEALGRNPREFLKSGQHERAFYQEMWDTILAGDVWRGELVNRRKDGSLYSEEMAITPVRQAGGAITHFIAIKQDISERRAASEALAQERNLLRTLIDNLPDVIYVKDRDGRFLVKNQADVRQMGAADVEVIVGQTDFDYYPPELAAQYHADDQAVMSSGQAVIDREEPMNGPSGRPGWRLTTKMPLRDAQGQIIGLVGIGHDITARKQREREQRERELEAIARVSQALRAATNSAEMLPILMDQIQGLLAADAAAIALHQAASAELVIAAAQGEFAGLTGRRQPAGAGVGGQILAKGQPFATNDLQSDPLFFPAGWPANTRVAAGVPLLTHEEALGVIVVKRAVPLAADELQLLAAIADIAGNALQRATLHEQTARRLERLAALRAIDQAIMNSLDLQLTLPIILGQVMGQLGVDAADILLLTPGLNLLTFAAGRGFRKRAIEQTRLRLGEGHAGQAALERRTVQAPDLQADPAGFHRGRLLAEEGFVALVCVPLVVKAQMLGVLEVWHRTPLNADAEWLDFLETLAGQAAIATADAQLFNDLQRSNVELQLAYDTTLEGWSRALDLRDHETEGHTQRVTELALKLARNLGLPQAELVHLRRGALLHDIGKMGVPDAILNKPGPLSEAEWVVMRQHPTLAHDLLAPIGFLGAALDVPYCHHEKWDGTGYPRGMAGEAIPLAARIFAVADVWDALTADRPYRAAWPTDKARAYLRDEAGRHFDPQVVAAFEAWQTAEAATGPQGVDAARPALLIVDDEANVLRSLARSLRDEFTIFTADSGQAALAVLKQEAIAVILTDQRMAGLTGLELLRQAQAVSPATRALLISGYTDSAALGATLHLPNVRGFIPKPWNVADLDRQLRAAADEYAGAQREQQVLATLKANGS